MPGINTNSSSFEAAARFEQVSQMVGRVLLFYALVGAFVSFIGWPADVPRWTDWDADGITTQPNAAIAAGAASLCLLLATHRSQISTALLAGLVFFIGGTSLLQHIAPVKFELLNTALMFDREWGRDGTVAPGLMGPPGSICWTLIGFALLLREFNRDARFRRTIPLLGIVSFSLSTLSLVGYLFRVDKLFAVPNLTIVALQTSTFIAAISIALIISIPEHSPMRWMLDKGATGSLARRAVPVVLFGPFVIATVRLAGEQAGWYDTRFGIALFAMLLIVLLMTTLAWSLGAVSRHERVQLDTERRLRETVDALAMDFAAFSRLQALSTQLVHSGELNSMLTQILDAASEFSGSNRGNIQLFEADTQQLRAAVQCGPDFSARLSSVTSTPLQSRSGELLGMLNIYFDSAHSASERELKYMDVLARLAADVIERSKVEQSLRDADRHKNSFLATLAHELRGPLAPIKNSVEILNRLNGESPPVRRAIEIMQRQISQMVRLIDDLLDINRISSDKLALKRERVELQSVVQQAVESCMPSIEQFEQRLSVDLPLEPVYLNADRARLVQVFANLLNNASKFTPVKGLLRIVAERRGNECELRVQDNGIGIPPDKIENVFGMFNQLGRPLEAQHGGLGLGLYLVKRLVEMHGGTVTAYSEGTDRGTEFVVRVPIILADAQPMEFERQEVAASSSGDIHITND